MNMHQFRPKAQAFRVCTFWMSGKMTDSRRRPTQQAILVSFNPCLTHSHLITAFQTRKQKTFKKNIKMYLDLALGCPNLCMHFKRLDNPPGEAALAADLITASPTLAKNINGSWTLIRPLNLTTF